MKPVEPREINDEALAGQIKAAFEPLKAEPALIARTKLYVAAQRAQQVAVAESSVLRRPTLGGRRIRRLSAALAGLLLVLSLSFFWNSYQTQVAAISLDGNASLELGLNRYERVISVRHFGEDGALPSWVAHLQLKNRRYNDAVALLLADQNLQNDLGAKSGLELTVVSETGSEQQFLETLQNLAAHSAQKPRFFAGDCADIQPAKELGLSMGKYRVYRHLLECGLETSPERLRALSMAELEELLATCPLENGGAGAGAGNGSGTGNARGTGSGTGNGTGNGAGSGKGPNAEGSGRGEGSPTGKGR